MIELVGRVHLLLDDGVQAVADERRDIPSFKDPPFSCC